MNALQIYLQSPKTRATLSRKPGDAGFSLIELVVVVAVLAILAAIAIPSFTSINDKARASAAANTIAQIAKECAVKAANAEALTFNVPELDFYTVTPASGNNCEGDSSGWIVATSDTPSKVPTFQYNVNTGAKACSGVAKFGCSAATNGKW